MNSADLTALGVLPPRSARGILEDLHRIPLISVRDADSQALCREHGIAADLAPDMVHTLLGKVRDLPAPRSLPVLLQVSDAHLSRVGADALLDPLASSPTVSQTGVAIMCAGTASGHDSFEKAEELAAGLTERKIGVTIVRERQPEALLRLIAGSTAVVATSLHLRILACAHAVPRVSLPIAKVTCYARTWDDRMPFDVAAPDLAEALDVRPHRPARPGPAARRHGGAQCPCTGPTGGGNVSRPMGRLGPCLLQALPLRTVNRRKGLAP